MNALNTIIYNHFTWNDLLSLKIKAWGNRDFDEAELESAVAHLFKEVLLTSFFTQVKDPILHGQHTWNRDEFDAYLSKFSYLPLSPFDGEPLSYEAVVPHTFALKIMEWTKTLPFMSQELVLYSPIKTLGVVAEGDYQEASRQLTLYIGIAKIAQNQLVHYTQSAILKNMALEAKSCTETIKEYKKLDVERQEREKEAFKVSITKETDFIKQCQSTTKTVMASRVENYEHDLNRAERKVSDKEKEHAAQLNQIADLEQKLRSL